LCLVFTYSFPGFPNPAIKNFDIITKIIGLKYFKTGPKNYFAIFSMNRNLLLAYPFTLAFVNLRNYFLLIYLFTLISFQ
jgi:hypothetical protein